MAGRDRVAAAEGKTRQEYDTDGRDRVAAAEGQTRFEYEAELKLDRKIKRDEETRAKYTYLLSDDCDVDQLDEPDKRLLEAMPHGP
jgi:hypothetical protein